MATSILNKRDNPGSRYQPSGIPTRYKNIPQNQRERHVDLDPSAIKPGHTNYDRDGRKGIVYNLTPGTETNRHVRLQQNGGLGIRPADTKFDNDGRTGGKYLDNPPN